MVTVDQWDISTEVGFMACYRASLPDVYRYAAALCGADRQAAEDIVHDVFVNALVAARRGDVRDIHTGYLRSAVRHRWIDRWRSDERERKRVASIVSLPPAEPDSGALPELLLAQLPDRERTALVLRFVDDLPVAKVGSEMGISARAAESLLARAMRRLRRAEVDHA